MEIRWLDLGQLDRQRQAILERRLDDRERAQALRFRFEDDRQAYIGAHALVRTMLSEFAPVRPSDWRFGFGPHGKPELVVPYGVPRLKTNISHTRGLAVAAVTIEHDIGIDVECLNQTNFTMSLAPEVLSPIEMATLGHISEMKNSTLFAIWTLKEAYVKALGIGFCNPPSTYAFRLDPIKSPFCRLRPIV